MLMIYLLKISICLAPRAL